MAHAGRWPQHRSRRRGWHRVAQRRQRMARETLASVAEHGAAHAGASWRVVRAAVRPARGDTAPMGCADAASRHDRTQRRRRARYRCRPLHDVLPELRAGRDSRQPSDGRCEPRRGTHTDGIEIRPGIHGDQRHRRIRAAATDGARRRAHGVDRRPLDLTRRTRAH